MAKRTPQDRFWAKVDKSGDCWLWKGSQNGHGYGRFRLGSLKDGSRRIVQAHRFAYEFLVGPIPKGLVIDHLCRTRHCVNPAHMEPVTNRENVLRGDTLTGANAVKTHCPRGHVYDAQNTYIRPGRTDRECRICRTYAFQKLPHPNTEAPKEAEEPE